MNITVVGAGNAGCAATAMLSLRGHDVTLYEFWDIPNNKNFACIREHGTITATHDGKKNRASVHAATDDEAAAFREAEVVLIFTQTIAHPMLAEKIAPFLRDGQVVVLAPGYCGSLYFLKQTGSKDIIYGEGESIPFDARLSGPGQVTINFTNIRNPIGFLPARRKDEGLAKIRGALETYCCRDTVLESALHNPNLIVHTVGAIMSVARIEYSKGDFSMYEEAFTPCIWSLLVRLDEEKHAVVDKLGLRFQSFVDGFSFRTSEENSQDSLSAFKHYTTAGRPPGPSDPRTRYITEDVPMGLCLLESCGRKVAVPTPVCSALIDIASALHETDYRRAGRTLEHLGIASLSLKELHKFLENGSLKDST